MNIKRNIFNKLEEELSTNNITILIGARQVGKTYLLRQLEGTARQRGLTTAFFDLEQPADLMKFNEGEAEIIERLCQVGQVVFIDEFHYLKNASHIFKAIHDRNAPVKIFASGSSSLAIHQHLKESLVGRKIIYSIYPCSLDEIAQVAGPMAFPTLCRFGGMPGTLHHENDEKKQRLLEDILQSYLLKDIKALIREENLRAFNHLLYLLAQSQGSLVSVASLSQEVGMTARTIESYLEVMAHTYVNFPLHSYSGNLGNELKKSKKYYLYDLGVRNALLKNFAPINDRADSGALLEGFVFGELQKKLRPDSEIRFWRLKTGDEVDFLWIKDQKPYPIEVKQTWHPGEIPKGLKAFLKRYPKTKRAAVMSKNQGDTIQFEDTEVLFRSFDQVASLPEELVG